jgi:hypothetical protein
MKQDIPRVAGRLLQAPEGEFRPFSTGDAWPGVEVPRRTGQQANSRAEPATATDRAACAAAAATSPPG